MGYFKSDQLALFGSSPEWTILDTLDRLRLFLPTAFAVAFPCWFFFISMFYFHPLPTFIVFLVFFVSTVASHDLSSPIWSPARLFSHSPFSTFSWFGYMIKNLFHLYVHWKTKYLLYDHIYYYYDNIDWNTSMDDKHTGRFYFLQFKS
jgi:hypothetical protein